MSDTLARALAARLGSRFEDKRGQLLENPDPRIRFGWMDSRRCRYLCFHHSQSGRNTTPEAIARHHVQHNGWAGGGYHFYIALGKLYYIGDVDTMRAHVAKRNDEALGICFAGDYRTEQPASEDLETARDLVAVLDAYYGHKKELTSHRGMLPGYTCPGDNMQAVIPSLRRAGPPPEPPKPPPPAPTFAREDMGRATWFVEELARQIRAQGDEVAHNAIVEFALPAMYRERDK